MTKSYQMGRAIGVNPLRLRASIVTYPASGNAFTPQLFASHVGQQNIELQFRQVFADPLEAERQILSYTLLTALHISAVDSARIQENIREASCHCMSDLHRASHGRGNVAVAPRQKGGSLVRPVVHRRMVCVTARLMNSKLASTTERRYLSSPSLRPLSGSQPFRLKRDSYVRDFPTSPHFRSASIARQYPGASGDAFLSPGALMIDSPAGIAGSQDHGDSTDDGGLFAFTNALHLSVRAKVLTEQNRGLSLSEIVIQVREMVRIAEENARQPRRFPSRAFRAISRQAVAWCVESYRPLAFAAGIDRSKPRDSKSPNGPAAESLSPVVAPPGETPARFPAMSPTYRGLP